MWVGKPVAPRRCFFFWFRAPARPALVFTSFIRPTLCRVESIAEQRTAHRWLRPEVRDDAVVTRPSCLHRHGIRSSGARERPPTPPRPRMNCQRNFMQPKFATRVDPPDSPRLTPFVFAPQDFYENLFMSEKIVDGHVKLALVRWTPISPTARPRFPRSPIQSARNPTTLTRARDRPRSPRSSPARTRRRRGASGRPPTTGGTSARRNWRAGADDRRAGHRPSPRPCRASSGRRRGPSRRWAGGDRGRETTRRTRRCSIAETRTRGRYGRRR